MTKLIITRKKGFIGCLQTYKIWIDGEVVATIKNNKTIELEINSGTHKIQAGVDSFNGISAVKIFKAPHDQTIKFIIFRPKLATIALLLSPFTFSLGVILLGATIQLAFPLNYVMTFLMFMPTILIAIVAVKLAVDIKRIK